MKTLKEIILKIRCLIRHLFFYTPSIKDAGIQDTFAIVWPTASMPHKIAELRVCQVHIKFTRGGTPFGERGK